MYLNVFLWVDFKIHRWLFNPPSWTRFLGTFFLDFNIITFMVAHREFSWSHLSKLYLQTLKIYVARTYVILLSPDNIHTGLLIAMNTSWSTLSSSYINYHLILTMRKNLKKRRKKRIMDTHYQRSTGLFYCPLLATRVTVNTYST